MNPEIKAKWIEALRSGEFKQGTRRLERYGAFCCFGVLCRVTGTNYDLSATHAPKKVLQEWGLDPSGTLPAPVMFNNERAACLIDLNDFGADFNFIADVIEKQL